MAEGIYRRIAPPDQKYPLRAVTLIRRLLQEGASEAFVLDKYRMHAWACGEISVTPTPFISYMAELLEVFLLDSRAAQRYGTTGKRSVL